MTRLLEFLIALLIVMIIFIAFGAMLPSERLVTRSAETDRPASIVFDVLNNLQQLKQWNVLSVYDPLIQYTVSGQSSGAGARLEYNSLLPKIRRGSWQITNSREGKLVEFTITDPSFGKCKKLQFTFRTSETDPKKVRITATYYVNYGMNLIARYAGLYVQHTKSAEIAFELNKIVGILSTIPNIDYRAIIAGKPIITEPTKASVAALDRLVVQVGAVQRTDDALRAAVRENTALIDRFAQSKHVILDHTTSILLTDFNSDTYVFDIAKSVILHSEPGLVSVPDHVEDKVASPLQPKSNHAVNENLSTSPSEDTSAVHVALVHSGPHNTITTQFSGSLRDLGTAIDALRAWAMTHNYFIVNRPYATWDNQNPQNDVKQQNMTLYWDIE